MAQHALASGMGTGEIETSQAVIDYYNPNGTGPSGYFFYKGIAVYPHGKTEEIKLANREQIGKRLHGVKEGEVVGT